MRFRFAFLLCAIAFAGSFSPVVEAVAADAVPAVKAKPALTIADVKVLQDWQAKSKSHVDYIGSRYGMDLWIATNNNILQLIYTTPDHQAMLMDSALIGPNGEDATGLLQRDFVTAHPDQAESMLKNIGQNTPLPQDAPSSAAATTPTSTDPVSKSEKLWQDLANAKTVSFGNANAPTVYMLADLQCDHCKDLWLKLYPAVAANSLHLKVLPVAILGKKSELAASSVLSQADPAAAWMAHIKGDATDQSASSAGTAAFMANQALAKRYKLETTPLLIYRDHATDKVKLLFGNPADMAVVWTGIGLQRAADAPATSPTPNMPPAEGVKP